MKKLLLQSCLSLMVITLMFATMIHNSMMSMNPMISKTLPYALVVLLCGICISFIMEHGGDEREELHKMLIDRYLLLFVTLSLTGKIFTDQLYETYTPWVVYTLVVVIVAKAGLRVYYYLKK